LSSPAGPPRVRLEAGRERPLLGRHPWVFSGAIRRVEGEPSDGDEVDVYTSDGAFVARGLFNSRSQIRVRLYSWTPGVPLDDAFFAERLARALALRRALGLLEGERSAARLVFSEGDGLSGLVVDRYGPWIAVQLTSLALARRLDGVLDALEALLHPRGVYLRTEKGILEEEGLELVDGRLRGDEPEEPIPVEEASLTYLVDLRIGQKTGFFLDHRLNRARAAAFAPGRRVADVFCYTGGFTLPLLRAGAASVVGVDVSAPALELARRNAAENGLDGPRLELVRSDAFRWLEARAEAGEAFDMVVLDPPRFARSSRGVAQALRGYAGLNELALRCLRPGGILVTCSCTGRVTREAFTSALATAESRTGRRIRVLESRGQGPDHPVSPTCPETEYLKCLICAVE
jgi:23S rRNA (cytosine1962-C5)-methyltransferase